MITGSNRAGSAKVVAAAAAVVALAGLAASPAVAKEPKTLNGALSAARAASCADCVSTQDSRAVASRSAARGLVELVISDPAGGGAVYLWGYTGSRWAPLVGYQDTVPYPSRLPARIWICVDENNTNVRSGPGTRYRVVTKVTADTKVPASQFKLTRAQPSDSIDAGEGWYKVTARGRTGWVASFRVANSEGCSFWRSVS